MNAFPVFRLSPFNLVIIIAFCMAVFIENRPSAQKIIVFDVYFVFVALIAFQAYFRFAFFLSRSRCGSMTDDND